MASGSREPNERVGRQFNIAELEAIGELVKGFVLNFDIKEFFLDVGHLELSGDVGSAEIGLGGFNGEYLTFNNQDLRRTEHAPRACLSPSLPWSKGTEPSSLTPEIRGKA